VIPQSFIQELLARVDIVDVVGKHVRLKKGGANWMGLCPFHGEKSPSFTVSPTKQFYHCFGCGAHGSAIGFLMEHAGLGYVDAIHELAREAGLSVPDEGGPADARRRDPDLIETLAAAARFYKLRLKDAPHAIDYLKGRGVSGETAARFGIGYAPDGWRGLEAAVPDYSAATLVESGLVIESEPDAKDPKDSGRRRRYDRFRDRIMFPIRNPRGQVIGFGGRVLGQGEPKYLNSPETPLFSKGRELYGLFEGRDAIRAADCVIVVEGYMDVVMLAQHGVRHAVATLGTATTALHVQKLLRLVDRVVFAFDGDAAGRRAAWRALEACLPHAADTKRIDFLFLPPEHDPDSFVRERGAEGFAESLSATQPLSEFLMRELAGRVDLATPEGRARFQAEARPLLLAMPPAALRLQLVQTVAGKVGIRAEDLLRYLDAESGDGRGGQGSASRRDEGTAGTGRMDSRQRRDGTDAGRPGGWTGGRTPAGAFERGMAGGGDGRQRGDPSNAQGGRWQGGGQGEWGGGQSGSGGPGGRGEGGWQGGGGRWSGGRDRWRPAIRPLPVALPDLQRRARLLLALHPALAREAWQLDFVPETMVAWLGRLAGLPEGASFAALVESLRADQPELASALETEATQDRGLLAELGIDEARREVDGALNQMRSQQIREEVDRLVQQGLQGEAERARYTELQALRKTLTSAEGA
jgi:DNA primase